MRRSSRAAARVPPSGPSRVDRLQELQPSHEESATLWLAEEELVAECMKSRGFEYWPQPADDETEQMAALAPIRRGDVEAARTSGYGLWRNLTGGTPTRDPPRDPNADLIAAMDPARRDRYLEALRGPNISPTDPSVRSRVASLQMPGGAMVYWFADSCFAQARSRLYGDDYQNVMSGPSHVEAEENVEKLLEADGDYTRAKEAWRACMQRSGYSVANSTNASADLLREFHSGKLTLEALREREILIATADAECFTEADLGPARRAAYARAERNVVSSAQDRLSAIKLNQQTALARAASVLDRQR
ncbi:MAG TPA: hypothetical protein VJV78_24095 [Polyangiales bacterium]|nr:hypothetical protein [Polyangiales bacterium]